MLTPSSITHNLKLDYMGMIYITVSSLSGR